MSSEGREATGLADRLDAWTERCFRAALAASGKLSAPVPRLTPTGGQRVLVVAPHPDDEAAGCAGVLAAHRAVGDEIRIVVVTDGGRSTAGGLDREKMVERRAREARVAADLLGASLVLLELPEDGLGEEDVSKALATALSGFRPDVVYAPSGLDYHPVHVAVAGALARALRTPRQPEGGPGSEATVCVYQVHVPLAGPLVNRVAPVDPHAGAVVDLLRAHASQWESLARTLRLRRYAAARHGLPGLAEEFLALSPTGYAAGHAALAQAFTTGPRGLRYRSFTDPLAYVAGGRARRAFFRAVRSEP